MALFYIMYKDKEAIQSQCKRKRFTAIGDYYRKSESLWFKPFLEEFNYPCVTSRRLFPHALNIRLKFTKYMVSNTLLPFVPITESIWTSAVSAAIDAFFIDNATMWSYNGCIAMWLCGHKSMKGRKNAKHSFFQFVRGQKKLNYFSSDWWVCLSKLWHSQH